MITHITASAIATTLLAGPATAVASDLRSAQVINPQAAPQIPLCAKRQSLPRSVIERRLWKHYGETRVGGGATTENQPIVELFISPAGTWTLLSTFARGEQIRSCALGAGVAWDDFPARPTAGRDT